VTVAILATGSFAQEQRGKMFPFETVDADKDGQVTKAELDAYQAAQTAATDANSDGKLSVGELTAMHLAEVTERATDMATRMVERLDTDADKALSVAELEARPMPAMMFDKADADSDGAVTKAEFDTFQAEMKDQMGKRQGKDGQGRESHGKSGHGRLRNMMGSN
jgi:hypothetical protein